MSHPPLYELEVAAMSRPCYGSYENIEECASCALLYQCIDLTIAIDHSDEEWSDYQEWRSYVEDLVDCRMLKQIMQYRKEEQCQSVQ